MRKLNLQGTEVTDCGLAYIKGLIGLRVLMLNKTGVTDAGVCIWKQLTICERWGWPKPG